jgi:hypothetical protein
MNAAFRVSRYDPALRDREGRFTGSAWTSATDIGRVFDGKQLTVTDYREAEDRYVRAVLAFASCTEERLTLLDVEHHGGQNSLERAGISPLTYDDLTSGDQLSAETLARVARLCLREVIWCRAEGSNGFYLHFGYDYLMYLGGCADFSPALQAARDDGLYVERRRSPYG